MRPVTTDVLSKLRNRPLNKIRLLGRIARMSHKVAPFPGPGFTRTYRRALKLYLQQLYYPEESFDAGLLDPGYPGHKLRDHISRAMMSRLQKSVNPDSWTRLTEDKGIFYRYCLAQGLPVPELYALCFRDKAGWSHSGTILQDKAAWLEFLNNSLPEEFVIKPALGVYGSGLRVLRRSAAGGFTDASGLQQDAADIYAAMLSHPGYDSFVIQERVRNHPELARLSNSEYLQTLRLVTYIDSSGSCRILYGFFKPIVGINFSDNHDHGKTGNLVTHVNLEQGTLRPATIMTTDGSGEQTITAHPTTGMPFEGFPLPFWEESCELAREAARKFLPLRTVGWDIAITADGPLVIEGNDRADPFHFDGAGDVLAPLFNRS